MRGQPIRISGRILAAAVVSGVALLAAASPGHAATSTAAQAAAAKAKYIQASGFTGKQVHATWAGPSVGAIAWTVGSDFVATKTNAYRSCRNDGVPYSDPTGSGDTITLKQFRRC